MHIISFSFGNFCNEKQKISNQTAAGAGAEGGKKGRGSALSLCDLRIRANTHKRLFFVLFFLSSEKIQGWDPAHLEKINGEKSNRCNLFGYGVEPTFKPLQAKETRVQQFGHFCVCICRRELEQ